MEDNINFEM